MIHSLFMINQSGEVFMEKHWKSIINRSICDYFFDSQKKSGSKIVPPIIPTPNNNFLITIHRKKIHFVAIVTEEVSPLLVIEFLHRMVDIFEDYFNDCNESIIKEHYVVVYELLDEMLDNGYPLAMESNVLKELIKPPNILRTIANTVTGKTNVSATLPDGQVSTIPWRRVGVKYANNEAYFDVIEEIDAIIDRSGSVVSAEIQGYIDCCIKLSGMPDLLLSFMNPRLFDDVSFHPCVRYRKWDSEKVLSFVPPDGNFRLMSYHIGTNVNGCAVSIPIFVKHNIMFRDGCGGRIELQLGSRNIYGKSLEGVLLEIIMPKSVVNVHLNPNQGKYTFDSTTKLLLWDVGRMETGKSLPTVRGTILLQSGSSIPDSNPTIHLKFSINQYAISGVKVNRLDMYEEKYKPFKGVKYVTRSGNFQIRT